jgi:hypothetical protein
VASFLLSADHVEAQHLSSNGGATTPEFMVVIDHITYDTVQAEDEITAIDLVLEGQGLEISSETRDAYISEYDYSDTRPHGRQEGEKDG